jgi:type VI protein secretion system component Hcp
MRLSIHFRWGILFAFLLTASFVQAEEIAEACFNGVSTLATNPISACPGGVQGSGIRSFTAGGTDQVTLSHGNPQFAFPIFKTLTLTKERDLASDGLLKALYAQKVLPTVVIAGYSPYASGSAPIRNYTILLTNAYVTSWNWSGSPGDESVVENVTLAFQAITIVDNTTGQSVTWSPAGAPAS